MSCERIRLRAGYVAKLSQLESGWQAELLAPDSYSMATFTEPTKREALALARAAARELSTDE